MKLIETIRLNCNNEDIAVPERSEVVRLCISRMYSHSTLIASICPVFTRAQLMWQENAISGPVYVSVIFTEELDHKRKDADTETVYERLIWFIKSLRAPDCGMIISVYQNLNAKRYIMDPWHLHHIWPFKDQWEPKGEYITIHHAEPKLGGTKKDKVLSEAPVYLARVMEMADKYGYDVKTFSYAMPWQEIYDGLRHSDHHFTYIGSTYYLAGCMNTPTTGFSYSNTHSVINGSYYDYETGVRTNVTIPETRWGIVGLNRTRTIQYDFDLGAVVNKPVDYVKEISEVDQVDDIFKNMINT